MSAHAKNVATDVKNAVDKVVKRAIESKDRLNAKMAEFDTALDMTDEFSNLIGDAAGTIRGSLAQGTNNPPPDGESSQ